MIWPMLSRLPLSWCSSEILGTLSMDCQAYVRCERCCWEHRVDVWGVTADARERKRRRCTHCGRRKLASVVHRLHVTARCDDCNAESELVLGAEPPIVCSECGSARVEPIGEPAIEPPFPERFGDVRKVAMWPGINPEHTWGESGIADSQQIMREAQQVRGLPEDHRYAYALIAFARRLRLQVRDADWEERYWLSNLLANLEQNYFRDTGSLDEGIEALDCFDDMVALAGDEAIRAIAQHSYAMGVYSLLARYPEEYIAALAERTDLRAGALARAAESARVLEGYALGDEGAAWHLARVRYVIGDLLRVGAVDDDERRAAIEEFDAALENDRVVKELGFGIRAARASTIMNLADPGSERFEQAVEDLQIAAEAGGSDRAYAERWRPAFLLAHARWRYDSREHALGPMERAGALALQQVSAFGDEVALLYKAEELVEVFETLAALYVDLGWVDEALATVELMRGLSMRLYTVEGEERDAVLEEVRARQLEDLLPASIKDATIELEGGERVRYPSIVARVSQRSMDDYFEQTPIGPAVMACLNHHADLPTALVSVFLDERSPGDWIVSALLCRLVDRDQWVNERAVWRPDPAALEELRRAAYVDPGPFRERLLARACARGREALLAPVLAALEDAELGRLIVSMPGTFGKLPVEALGAESLSVINLPSVRVGADLLHGADAGPRDLRDARVLLVGYEGDDIGQQEPEIARLRAAWGERLTLLPGARCTKRSVLEALREPYDIVHFLCHGSYDWDVPLASAVHFTPDREDDRRRVTAHDLLLHARLNARPLVIMSTCSSGLTADSRTNSFHGLSGSLFRVGARAIVGSRWPVSDALAAAVMGDLHDRLSATGATPDICLRDAREPLRAAGSPIEDWAAFAYFGVA